MAESYDDAIRRRLDIINQMGTNATSQFRQRIEIERQQQAAAQAAQAQAQIQSQSFSAPSYSNYSRGGPSPASGNNVNSFIRAIAKRESGGSYSARNRDSGALGKYQIMPGNIPGWSREALGHSVSASQFLRSPQLQEQIAQYQLKKYYNKWGPEGAAVAWYAGPGTAAKYVRSRGRGYGRPQGNYSSISAYALGILRSMGLR